MSADILPDYIVTALTKIIKQENLTNYNIRVQNGSSVGDGFLSELYSITITGKCENIQIEKKLNLLCKLPPSNENRLKEFISNVVFRREAYFYTNIVPTFREFQREKKIPKEDQFRAYPECYMAIDDENDYAIIMEDLRARGFKMWNKAKPNIIENSRLVVQELGKFHGISFALKDQRPDVFAEFKHLTDISDHFFESQNLQAIYNSCLDRAINAVTKSEHKEIFKKLQANTLAYFNSCTNQAMSAEFGVVAHGDFWNNNMMFRFDKDDVADEVCFIDWQIIRYVSPAIDLLNLIFSSTDKHLRTTEYMNLLKYYHESVAHTIRLLGSDPDKLFTFDNLLNEMKKCGSFAFLTAPMILQVSLADSSNISDMNELSDQIANGNENQDMIKGLTNEAQKQYEIRLNDVMDDLVELNYFNEIK